MVKAKLQPLKGFRDFLPEKMAVRREVIKRLVTVFEKYGFDELQTPALEYQEVLLGKYGKEAERLMYLFKDAGGRDVGLRYDLTVPLARVMTTYRDLPIPFKRYQIQPVWRAEKPQKARYREVYQCDVDIVGSASPIADAEILAINYFALAQLGFDSFKIRVNSRQVLFNAMKSALIPKDNWFTTIASIDKLDKKSKDSVIKELSDSGLTKTQIEKVLKAIETSEPDEFLEQTIKFAEKLGVGRNLIFDPKLARGLDYYTGPIFESVVEKPKVGSITGGGRYDKLLKDLGGPDLPATGSSFGLDRLVQAIEELKLTKDLEKTSNRVLVTIFSDKLLDRSIEVANLLRKSAIKTELYPDVSAKLDKQLKYADKKGIPWAVIIGPQEALKGEVVLKNLKTKKQDTIPAGALLARIK